MLVGLPGSGKSGVGRYLAALLSRAFIDTDDLVEELTGLCAAEHNLRSCDAGFRAVEEDAIEHSCRHRGAGIATGCGSVIRCRKRASRGV